MNRTKSGMSTLAAAAAICVAILHCLRASSEGDAAPVMYVDAGTNAVFEFEMPFAPAGSGFVDEWLSGPFEGDGSPLSDTVFRQSAMTGETTNAVFSVTSWIDPATGLPSDMPVEPGDLLSLVRMDTRPLEFSLHGFYEQEGLVPSRTSDALSKASGDSVVSGVADPPRSAPVLAPGLRKEFFRMAEKIGAARDFVQGAVAKIKGFFNFSWSLPHIKLPHFSVSGGVPPWGFGGKGSLPSISVSWYAKAMERGMILRNPTIFGAMGGKLLGGGERGAEAVVGVSSLDKMIRRSVQSAQPVRNFYFGGINIYGANKTTEQMAREFQLAVERRLSAFA